MKSKVQKKSKQRASVSSSTTGGNLSALLAEVNGSIHKVADCISSSSYSTPQPVKINPLDAAMNLFTKNYSEPFNGTQRLKFQMALATNKNFPSLFLNLDDEERGLLILSIIE